MPGLVCLSVGVCTRLCAPTCRLHYFSWFLRLFISQLLIRLSLSLCFLFSFSLLTFFLFAQSLGCRLFSYIQSSPRVSFSPRSTHEELMCIIQTSAAHAMCVGVYSATGPPRRLTNWRLKTWQIYRASKLPINVQLHFLFTISPATLFLKYTGEQGNFSGGHNLRKYFESTASMPSFSQEIAHRRDFSTFNKFRFARLPRCCC